MGKKSNINIVNNLQEFRENNKFSKKELADFIGCSPSLISRIESGERELTDDIADKIIRFFKENPQYRIDVNRDYLIGKTGGDEASKITNQFFQILFNGITTNSENSIAELKILVSDDNKNKHKDYLILNADSCMFELLKNIVIAKKDLSDKKIEYSKYVNINEKHQKKYNENKGHNNENLILIQENVFVELIENEHKKAYAEALLSLMPLSCE